MDIQRELTEVGREAVAGRLLIEQRIRFKGSKKAAYTAAGVNAATWERAITEQRVRPDRLVQIVTALWPESGGDWQAVPPPDQVRKPVFASDLDALSALSSWVREAAVKGHETPPPTQSLILWDFEQLIEGVRAKHEEDMGLRELNERLASSDVADLQARLAAKSKRGGDEGDEGSTPATRKPDSGPDQPSSSAGPQALPTAASRIKGESSVNKRRRRQDDAAEASQDDGNDDPI